MPPAMRDFGMPLAKSFEDIIGVRLSATNAEKPTAAATVTPNSPNRRPVSPVMNDTGTNTAISTSVVAMTAKPISFEPLMEASTAGSPASMRRTMFSSTTMASSTTRPMASTAANNVSVLIE